MAIVKMKKLRVVAMADQREALLKGLLHLGCVEISEPDAKLEDAEWAALFKRETSALVETRTEIADVKTALDAIKQHVQTKDGLIAQRGTITEEEFLSDETVIQAKGICTAVNQQLQELSRLQAEENRLIYLATLQAERQLREGTASCFIRLHFLPLVKADLPLRRGTEYPNFWLTHRPPPSTAMIS